MLNAKRKMLNAKRRHYHINAAWYIVFWWWVGIFQSYTALRLRLSWECANTQSHLRYSCMMCWGSVWNSPGIRGGAKPNQKMGWIPGMLLASAVQKVCNVCGGNLSLQNSTIMYRGIFAIAGTTFKLNHFVFEGDGLSHCKPCRLYCAEEELIAESWNK